MRFQRMIYVSAVASVIGFGIAYAEQSERHDDQATEQKPEDRNGDARKERSTGGEVMHQLDRIGDEIGQNIIQGYRNAKEGYKKRFNTIAPEEEKNQDRK